MDSFYFDLLKTWCDGMLAHQLKDMGPAFDGALLCPACRYAHARCDNAVYPFLYMADATGDMRYVDAAIAVEKWQREAAFCDDGSCYNDTHASWAGITVFSAVALCEALERHSSMLPAEVKARWEEKLAKEGKWLRANLDEHAKTNINYLATNACALALVGKYLGNEEWMAQAKHLARYALARFTEHGLLWGEGRPWDKVTARGCRPIDIGYNVEESVPSLIKYAVALGDEEALEQLTDVLRKQLFFFLPDGAWDNSFGSRNNKWTYYGSRTSDGCCAGYALLADRDPRFAEVARRNLRLMAKCTFGGLLAGGPDYEKAGEYPCIHHTFTHANALAAALDAGLADKPLGAKLPLDDATAGVYTVPELGLIRVNAGPMTADITTYDWDLHATHASGGVLSLLHHREKGPFIAGSVVEYRQIENVNQQLSTKKSREACLLARAELPMDGLRFSQAWDTEAAVQAEEAGTHVLVNVSAALKRENGHASGVSLWQTLDFGPDALTISGRFLGKGAEDARYVLPLITGEAETENETAKRTVFNLTGGFMATEITVTPDSDGCFAVTVKY